MFEANVKMDDEPPHLEAPPDRSDPTAVLDGSTLESVLQLPDAAFDALASTHRRQVVEYLWRAGRPVTVSELALVLSSARLDVPPSEVEADQRRRMAITLHHTHLPKLAACGFVERDEDGDMVSLTMEFDALP